MRRNPKQTKVDEALQMVDGGDMDTNACIVGGLVGALHGVSSIPNVIKQALLTCDTQVGRPRPKVYSTRELERLVADLVQPIST